VLITLGWFTEHGEPFDAQATGFHARLRHFVDSRVPESWRREVVEGQGWGMFGAAASPVGWNWNLVSFDQDGLVATVGLPVGLDDTVLSGGPIGVGRGVLAGRSVLDGVVPPFGVLVTDGTRFAAQQDWFGMASIYVYRSHGVVAFSNRPILLPYVFGDAIHPDAQGFARYASCDAFVGSVSPVMGVKPLGPGEAFIGKRNRKNTWKISMSRGTCLDDAAVAGARLNSNADLEVLAVTSFSRATSSLARLWPATDLLRCGLSGGRDSRLPAANLLAGGISPRFYTNTDNPEEGVVANRLIDLARGAGRSGIVHDLVPPRNGNAKATTGVEQRLTDLFWHYDFSYRRQFVMRGRRIENERIPPATINGAIGGIAWGAWVPENWSQSTLNPAAEMDIALRRGLIGKAGGPLCEPAAGWVGAYLGELIEHAALLGLDQVQSLTWMYCATRARTWPTARHNFHQTMLYATPEFVSAVIALPLRRMKSSAFHRRLTERLLPEWTGVDYVHGVGAAEHIPSICDGDGLQLLIELSERTTAELTWMLDRNKVRTALDRLRRGELDSKRMSKANRLLTTFAVLAEAERDFAGLNAELAAVARVKSGLLEQKSPPCLAENNPPWPPPNIWPEVLLRHPYRRASARSTLGDDG
jgi:hypothetical protein